MQKLEYADPWWNAGSVRFQLPFAHLLTQRPGEGPTIALLAEYDAPPEIGHGCGHRLIRISNLGADWESNSNGDSS